LIQKSLRREKRLPNSLLDGDDICKGWFPWATRCPRGLGLDALSSCFSSKKKTAYKCFERSNTLKKRD